MADETFDVVDDGALSGDPTVADTEYVEDGMVTTLTDGTLIGSYDTNDDNVIDITLVDEGADGTLDMIIDDVDYDGASDTVYVAGATMSLDEASGEIVDVTLTDTTEAVYDPSTTPLGPEDGAVTAPDTTGIGTTPADTADTTSVATPASDESLADETVVDTVYVEDGVITTMSDGTVISDFDTDADGMTDIEVRDEGGDGTADAILDDADYDGAIDTVYVAGATMAIDEATGEIVDVTETDTTEAVYDPSTVPSGPADYGPHTEGDV